MSGIKTHITGKFTAIILAMMMLLPTTVKIFHAFENYKHEVCTSKGTKHIHQIDHDCLFYKFHLNNPLIFSTFSFDLLNSDKAISIIDGLYDFKYNHQQLSFSLRAPPELA